MQFLRKKALQQTGLLFPGLLICIFSLIIMLGWLLQVEVLVSPFSEGVSRFNTAVMFLLTGLVMLLIKTVRTPRRRLLIWLPALMLLLLASGTLLQYLTGEDLNLDQLFIKDWMPPEQGQYPGRPSPATAVCFLILGLALTIRILNEKLTNRKRKRHLLLQSFYATLILTTGATVLFNIVVWITQAQDSIFGHFSLGQSLLTASLFLLASAALFLELHRESTQYARQYWLPTAVAFTFIALGGVIAGNIKDNQNQRYEKLAQKHLHNIHQLTTHRIAELSDHLQALSWRKDQLEYLNQTIKNNHFFQDVSGLVIEQQGSKTSRYGTRFETGSSACPPERDYQWLNAGLRISSPAKAGNPNKDLCLHALFSYQAILVTPLEQLNLAFETVIIPPGNVIFYPQRPHLIRPIEILGTELNVVLVPSRTLQEHYNQEYTAFLLLLSMILGLTAATAVYKHLKSVAHYNAIRQANIRLTALEARNRKVLEMAPEAVLLVDDNGTIVYSNRRSLDVFGYSAEEMIASDVERLIPEETQHQHRQYRSAYMQQPETREMGEKRSLFAIHKEGHRFPVDIVLSPIEFEKDRVVMAIIRDISDKVAEKKRIEQNLQEKDILLKEIYHRVKNNMQVIASLLRMQSRTADHEQTRQSLQEAALRISALALVHEKLYQSSDLSRASIRDYIESLTDSLRQNYLGPGLLQINIDALDEEFDPEVIVPIGLILNELISNAMKHAFTSLSDNHTASIQIEFIRFDAQSYRLSVCDNGVGLPENFDITTGKSLGLKLIKSLSAQLKAKLSIDSNNQQTCFRLLMPADALAPSASPMVSNGMDTKPH